MVLMIQEGISLEDIHKELASRHVIDHKVKQEKMTGKAQRIHPKLDGCFHHLLCGAFSVAEGGMSVQILKPHLVIFSCLTLWSMMWRLASSVMTSSTEIPSSTMSTITWYMRSAIS